MSDLEPIAAAIKDAIQANLPAGTVVYDLDEIPATKGRPGELPIRHVAIELNRRYVEERRAGGYVAVPGFDLITRCHGDSVTNVRKDRARVTAALEDQILPGDIGPFVFRIAEPEDDDDTGWFGADYWTF